MNRNNGFMKVGMVIAVLLAFTVVIWKPVSTAQVTKEPQLDGIEKGSKIARQSGRSSEVSTIDIGKAGFLDAEPNAFSASQALMVGTDQGTESEPNNTAATANPLTGTEGKIRGFINPSADIDYFSFNATAGDRIYASVNTSGSASSASINSALELRDSSDVLIEADADDGSFGSTASAIAGRILPTTGVYRLRITGGATIRPYHLNFAIRSGSPAAEIEPNGTIATATPLAASGLMSGSVSPAADADFYSMNLNAGDTIFLALDIDPERDNVQWNGRLGFGLFGSGTPNQVLVVNDASTGSVANPLSETFHFTVKDAGTYFAYVDEPAAGGAATFTYTLNVTVIPPVSIPNCTTHTNSTPTTIADLALSSSTITVPATSNRITDLDVFIDATHTLMTDLDWHLRSPAGNDNGIITDVGNNAVGSAETTMNWWLDDEAAAPANFFAGLSATMRVLPETAYRLDWFDGENPTGVWTLDIRDDFSGDTGTLNSWSLRICETTPEPSGTVPVYSQDFETDNGGFTHSGTVDEWEYGTPATAATSTTDPRAAFLTCSSGTKCWKTDLDATYDINSSMNLVSPSIAIPAGSLSPKLSWSMKYQLEAAAFDHAWVEVTNGSLTQRVWEWHGGTMSNSVGSPAVLIGESAGWGTYTADLSAFTGTSITVTFHVDGDSSANYPGMAVDDVLVTRFAPAVPVTISGRLTSGGRGIGRAFVFLDEGVAFSAARRVVVSNSFGYYTFFNVLSQQNVSVSVLSRRYTCPTNTFFLSGPAISDHGCTANF